MIDYLTCGQCMRDFPLSRIMSFIQHKKLDCEDDPEINSEESGSILHCLQHCLIRKKNM